MISGPNSWYLAGILLLIALIGGLLIERLRRRRASGALDERLRFEMLLSDLSADFAGPHDDVDRTIRDWLERLATFLGVDRAALIHVAPGDKTAYRVISYAKPGIEPSLDVITQEEWPWYIEQIRRGVTVNLPRILEDLPAEAAREREYVRRVGMKSHLSVPVAAGNSAICELTISTMRAYRVWPDDLIARLRVVGEIFAQAVTRNEIERALRESEQRYRSVVEHQTDLICRYLPDTTLTFVSDSYCLFWRKTREELIGTKFVELIPEVSRAAALEHVASIVERPRVEINEHEVLLPDGEIGWQQWIDRAIVDVDGQVVELQGIGRDITGRRRAEAALRESQRRYTLATSAGGVGVWDWNFETKELYVDPLLKSLLGFQDDEIGEGTEDWSGRVHPGDLDVLVSRLKEYLDGRIPGFEVEHRMAHKDGSVRWFLTRAAVVRSSIDTPSRLVGTCTDITDRRVAEDALRRARAELAHAGRVSALGELSASIAHELGQPLTAILSNAQAGLNLLAQDAPPLGELREILADIAKDNGRADEIIRRIRALMRKRELELQPLDVNELVRETAAFVAADAAARQIEITTELADALPPVLADRVHLQQLMLNLLINGMEAMVPVPPQARRLAVRTAASGEQVQIRVVDTGLGIPANLLPHVFEPFYTTKSGGMGMGLSIARTIVEAHGGRITVETGTAGGAIVSVSLPRVTREGSDLLEPAREQVSTKS